MITSEPKNWKELQNKVKDILECVNLEVYNEYKIETPRGQIEVDVYAIDNNSLDEIKYIIECKNWNNNIPQSVIHSFCTIMNETGGNIGYIISKKGFQKGAYDYVKNTNIKLLSFREFQEKYFRKWLKIYFSNEIRKNSFEFLSYTEPINSRRVKYLELLTKKEKEKFNSLRENNFLLSLFITKISYSIEKTKTASILDFESLKKDLKQVYKLETDYKNGEELLKGLIKTIKKETKCFNKIFKQNIFEE